MKKQYGNSVLLDERGMTLPVWYTFDKKADDNSPAGVFADENGSGINASAHGDVTPERSAVYGGAVRLGGKNGYISLPAGAFRGLREISLEMWMKASPRSYWERGFDFGRVEDGRLNAYIFYAPAAKRVVLSKIGHFSEEIVIDVNAALPEGWSHFVFEMKDGAVFVYINGRLCGEMWSDAIAVDDYVGLNRLYFGKSQYEADPYLCAVIGEIRAHGRLLTGNEIYRKYAAGRAEMAKNEMRVFELPAPHRLTKDISLPEFLPESGARLHWSSGNKDALSDSGKIRRPAVGTGDAEVTLTAGLQGGVIKKDFSLLVAAEFTDGERVLFDSSLLALEGDLSALTHDLRLPAEGEEGSRISWRAEGAIDTLGRINRPASGTARAALTATLRSGGETAEKRFDITVLASESADGFLFVYFTGNNANEERLHYALTLDGYSFAPMNGGRHVLEQTKGTRCLRDPFVIRAGDGYYHLVATDMQSSKGWNSNRGIITWRSGDLITWTDETVIEIADKFPTTEGADRVWAPQVIFDEERGEYMLYFAVRVRRPNPYTRSMGISPDETLMWYAYTKDFKSLTCEPRLLFRPARGQGIDGDIFRRGGTYYMYYKDESTARIKLTTAASPTGPYGPEIELNVHPGVGLEGVCVYQLPGRERWILLADAYGEGHYVMAESDDMRDFSPVPDGRYAFRGFHPRHGHVVPVSARQIKALTERFGVAQ